MRKTRYLILILLCYSILFNCKKEEVAKNENLTELNDAIVKIPDGLMIGSTKYELDIDKDKTIDLSIYISKSYSSMYAWRNYIQITPKNSYQLSYSNYVDTSWYQNPNMPTKIYEYNDVTIPKIFNAGDTIKFDGTFTNDSTMIVYYQNPGGAWNMYRGDIYRKAWVNIGYKYIALRQRKENVNKLAWIKLMVISSSKIILNSCSFIENSEELIIGK